MNIKLLLQSQNTKVLQDCSSKKKILEHIATLASEQLPEHSKADILTSLMNREKLGSTGIGNGIAIPHGKIQNSQNAVAVLLVNETAIHYDAIDNKPVDVFCALLVPEDQCDTHLETLASVAQLLDNKDTLRKIRKAKTDQDLYNIIEVA